MSYVSRLGLTTGVRFWLKFYFNYPWSSSTSTSPLYSSVLMRLTVFPVTQIGFIAQAVIGLRERQKGFL